MGGALRPLRPVAGVRTHAAGLDHGSLGTPAAGDGPLADFTWQHARRLAAEAGLDDINEASVARVLDELLTRGEHGPDTRSAKVAGRTRVAAAVRAQATAPETETEPEPEPEALSPVPVADFGVFDAAPKLQLGYEQA